MTYTLKYDIVSKNLKLSFTNCHGFTNCKGTKFQMLYQLIKDKSTSYNLASAEYLQNIHTIFERKKAANKK